jgi:2-hydroxy-3-oxopropionate reductase
MKDASATRSVAFLGAGLMAAPMIERLLEGGWRVHVWNRTRARMQPLVDRGAEPLQAPADATRVADRVLMCLMDAAAVHTVVFGPQGLVEGLVAARATQTTQEQVTQGQATQCKGADSLSVLVDHSSISPQATRSMATELFERTGMHWIDAPVSGGTAGAAAGTLAVMCGGNPAALAYAEPAIRAYAANITHMGETGSGQTTKLINQILVGSAMAAIAEAVALAQAAGIDAQRLPQALAGGWADSRPLQVFVPRMVKGYDKPVGAISTMLKDLDTVSQLAKDHAVPLPITTGAQQLMRMMVARGQGEDDPAAMLSLYRIRKD